MTKLDAEEANRMYWETELSVAEIAQRLDTSRRALYEALQPIAAEETCTVCGGAMEYANRSARDAGQGTCYVCATSSPQSMPAESESESWTWSPDAQRSATAARNAGDMQHAHMQRVRRLAGAALIGAVLGVVTTELLLRD
jgi:hypothetical protein